MWRQGLQKSVSREVNVPILGRECVENVWVAQWEARQEEGEEWIRQRLTFPVGCCDARLHRSLFIVSSS